MEVLKGRENVPCRTYFFNAILPEKRRKEQTGEINGTHYIYTKYIRIEYLVLVFVFTPCRYLVLPAVRSVYQYTFC